MKRDEYRPFLDGKRKINKDFIKSKKKKGKHRIKQLLRRFEIDDDELYEQEELKKNSNQEER